jgi:hypothetical protein
MHVPPCPRATGADIAGLAVAKLGVEAAALHDPIFVSALWAFLINSHSSPSLHFVSALTVAAIASLSTSSASFVWIQPERAALIDKHRWPRQAFAVYATTGSAIRKIV